MEKTFKSNYVGLALVGLSALVSMQSFAAIPVKVGGQVQLDVATFQGDAERGTAGTTTLYPDAYNSSAEFRRVEFYLKGELDEHWSYQIEWDADDSRLKDTWVGYAGLPVWIAVGRINMPQSLENWASSSSLTFMERAAAVETFRPDDGLGVYAEGNYHNLSYAAAVVLPDHRRTGFTSSDPMTAGGRITYTPTLREGVLLHLGGSLYYTSFDRSEAFSLTSRPEISVRETPNIIESVTSTAGVGNRADDAYVWGLELAGKVGPMLVQSEYLRYELEADGAAKSLSFDGWYLQASYVLTGESRTYDQQSGTFGRLTPSAKTGAWEIAMRYSKLDLGDIDTGWTDSAINKRGKIDDWTIGLNWYANKNIKVQMNYIRSRAQYELSTVRDRDVNIFGVRGQLRF